MMSPLISILIPVYNGAKFLDDSIGAVVAQTFADWELLLLDDGSTDDSHAVLTGWAARDARIRLFRQPNDGKGNVARNIRRMCSEAHGEYAFYMSQDDTMEPDCLETLANRARESDADIVLPDMLLRYADGSCATWPCSYPPGGDHALVLSPREAFQLAVDFSIHGFGLVRMRLMADERSDTRYYDSDEYNSRMQFLWANRVVFAPATFYYHQGNPDAITQRFSPRRFQRLQTALLLKEAYEREFAQPADRARLMLILMKYYIDTTLLFYTYGPTLSATELQEAVDIFRNFERLVNFAGYRREVLRHLNAYEQTFALCYFFFRSTRPFAPFYRWIHRLRKGESA